nr:YkgJ family cysteine cluster protein [Desulfobacterales bacterium]
MDLIDLVLDQYKKFDQIIERFCKTTGLTCVPNCCYCCRHWWVEATVLEVLPLAREIYARGQERATMKQIQEKQARKDTLCVFLLPEADQQVEGYCAYYSWRPLMCRLFGFAARRNKYGGLELCPCKVINETCPAVVRRSHIAIQEGLSLPVYQEAFFQVASIDPSRGYKRLPINMAIKEALEYLYWASLKGRRWKEASGY